MIPSYRQAPPRGNPTSPFRSTHRILGAKPGRHCQITSLTLPAFPTLGASCLGSRYDRAKGCRRVPVRPTQEGIDGSPSLRGQPRASAGRGESPRRSSYSASWAGFASLGEQNRGRSGGGLVCFDNGAGGASPSWGGPAPPRAYTRVPGYAEVPRVASQPPAGGGVLVLEREVPAPPPAPAPGHGSQSPRPPAPGSPDPAQSPWVWLEGTAGSLNALTSMSAWRSVLPRTPRALGCQGYENPNHDQNELGQGRPDGESNGGADWCAHRLSCEKSSKADHL